MAEGIHNPPALASSQHDLKRFIAVCAVIVGLCLALKLPTLAFDRHEYDERIYWALTDNWLHHGRYSLQGTEILKLLPPEMYDRPLFHHPPMMSILLAPFVRMNSPATAICVSWLGHALAIIGVAILVWITRRPEWGPTHFFLWLPILAMALDPVFTFSARKLWPDPVLGGFVAMAVGLAALAARNTSLGAAIGAGVLLAAAAMTKLPAIFVAPAIIILAAKSPKRRQLLVALLAPVTLALALWLVYFRARCGAFLPMWSRPSAALIAANTHIARAMSHPWHYYVSELALVTPAIVAVAMGVTATWRKIDADIRRSCAIWLAATIGGTTLLHYQGHAMHLRFMTAAMPGLYALFAATLPHVDPRRSLLPLLTLALVIYGIVGMGFYLVYGPQFDEILSTPEMLWRVWTEHR